MRWDANRWKRWSDKGVLVPIENATMEDRPVICRDKDDFDALGILKVGVLSPGMPTCIRTAFDLIGQHHQTVYSLATLPPRARRRSCAPSASMPVSGTT
ncbi:hypothetical protein ACFMPD_10710 [Sedimentitalea sp. HM32M-2]|uniref:hypothetical protein n=1 Tax=Sedimentitalea sp. HM32M-2 TaxID=3351566 RepID=UPI00362CB16F